MKVYSIQEFVEIWNTRHKDKSIILDEYNRRVQFAVAKDYSSLIVVCLRTQEQIKFIVDELFTIHVLKNQIEIGSAEYNYVFKIL